jgi:hypothetical protein
MEHERKATPAAGDYVIKIIHIDNVRRWLVSEWGGMYNAEHLDLETAKQRGIDIARSHRVDCWVEEPDGNHARIFRFFGETREAAVLRLFGENEKQYGYGFATLLDRQDKDKVHVIAPLTRGGFSYHLLPANYDFHQQLPTGPYQGNPVDWPHELFASLAEATEHRADMVKWAAELKQGPKPTE